jgi:hypothetical protein
MNIIDRFNSFAADFDICAADDHWRCRYTLAAGADLIVESEARYEFDGDLIGFLGQRITPEFMRRYEA